MKDDEIATLNAMLYGAEKWNLKAHRHEFRPRDRSRDLVKQEFVAFKEVKRTNVP